MDYEFENELGKLYIENELPTSEELATRCIKILAALSEADILRYVRKQNRVPEINAKNIPQFSSLDSINGVLDIVYSSNNITYDEIGYYFYPDSSITAQRKYGENHYKMATLLGLTATNKPFEVTPLGKEYMKLEASERVDLRNKLFLRIPIIQKIVVETELEEVRPLLILMEHLAKTTAIRRYSNVHKIVDYVVESLDNDLRIEVTNNIRWD